MLLMVVILERHGWEDRSLRSVPRGPPYHWFTSALLSSPGTRGPRPDGRGHRSHRSVILSGAAKRRSRRISPANAGVVVDEGAPNSRKIPRLVCFALSLGMTRWSGLLTCSGRVAPLRDLLPRFGCTGGTRRRLARISISGFLTYTLPTFAAWTGADSRLSGHAR